LIAAGLGLPAGVAAAAFLAACGSEAKAISVAEGTHTPTPSPTPSPPVAAPTATPSATEGAPLAAAAAVAAFDPADLGQGETALLAVRHPGAAHASVRFLEKHYPLIPGEDGLFWCVLGVGLLVPLGPGSATVTTRTRGGEVLFVVEAPYTVVSVDRPVDYLTTTPEVAAVLTVEAAETETYLRTFEQFNLFEGRPRWDGVIQQPVEGFHTTAFGQGRSINGGPVSGKHSGTDIANEAGTPVHAAAPGRIAWAGPMPIRGNTVLVDHGAGVVTGYHHLQEIEVAVGQMVAAGDEIALMGTTGFSTGPHLHWEMTIYGVNVDPMTWTTRVFVPSAEPVTSAVSTPAPTSTP
jgi:murein DD-endopeptidase MepM/ murein hydrolase activator NlpD